MNLDPFEEFPKEELWQALEHAHLKTFVSGLDGGLNYRCSEGGENLRYVICLYIYEYMNIQYIGSLGFNKQWYILNSRIEQIIIRIHLI